LRLLARISRLADGHDAWDERAEAALAALVGTENLEERQVGAGRIDRVVLDELERLHPPG
ncbi:MAG: putative peptidoglycan binding domain-containing protein, partial [Trueperaceae bacterium]